MLIHAVLVSDEYVGWSSIRCLSLAFAGVEGWVYGLGIGMSARDNEISPSDTVFRFVLFISGRLECHLKNGQ